MSLVVGVTGGIGSGKTSLVRLWKSLGARVIDADSVGKQLLGKKEVKREIVERFGAGVLDSRGEIDVGILGKLAFSSRERLLSLNAAVHPELTRSLKRLLREAKLDGKSEVVVLDAALIVEWGLVEELDVLVLVTAPLELRRKRMTEDCGMGERDFLNRVKAQLPDSEKEKYCHYVVRNDGSFEALQEEARRVWGEITGS